MNTLAVTHPKTGQQYELPYTVNSTALMLGFSLEQAQVEVTESWRGGGMALVAWPDGNVTQADFGARKPGSGKARKQQGQGGWGKRGQAAWRGSYYGGYEDVVIERA
jgi:hypothetical protein